MDFFTPYYGYDVTQLVEQYQGSKLEELFPNQQVVKNKMGKFLEFIWEEEKIPLRSENYPDRQPSPHIHRANL